MEEGILALQPPLYIKFIVISALCGWSALLAHKSIANFHDGLRPIFPEFLEGRMSRAELASIAVAISVGFVVGFGIPFTLATGIILIYLLLLPTDVIGVASPKWWIAVALGIGWGALIVGAYEGINAAIELLPVDFLSPLAELANPLLPIFSAFPAVAIAFQFGALKGFYAFLWILFIRELVVFIGPISVGITEFSIDPNGIGILVGMLVLFYYAVKKSAKDKAEMKKDQDEPEEDEKFFSEKAKRIRKNLPYLAVQGALLALASRLWIFAGSEVAILPLAEQELAAAGLADIARGFGFLPLIATTALATGVYQAVGFTFVYPAGYLMPFWWMAPFAGALIISGEILLLERIGMFLDRFPALREAGDHIRGAITKVMEVALLIGSAIAANAIVPGGFGFLGVGMLYILNEVADQKVSRMTIGPVAAIIVGILANILAILGIL